jgi:hypothetical protein
VLDVDVLFVVLLRRGAGVDELWEVVVAMDPVLEFLLEDGVSEWEAVGVLSGDIEGMVKDDGTARGRIEVYMEMDGE